VDSNGNLILTGIVKPKNIQLECKEFCDTPTTDPYLSTDDIHYAYIQNNRSKTFINATINTNTTCTLKTL